MHKPHVPIERDIAAFVRAYRHRGGDEGELLIAIGRAFPGCSYGAAGLGIHLANKSAGGAHDRAA